MIPGQFEVAVVLDLPLSFVIAADGACHRSSSSPQVERSESKGKVILHTNVSCDYHTLGLLWPERQKVCTLYQLEFMSLAGAFFFFLPPRQKMV